MPCQHFGWASYTILKLVKICLKNFSSSRLYFISVLQVIFEWDYFSRAASIGFNLGCLAA